MRWGASVVAGSVGMAVSQAPAAGPDWERTKARVAVVIGGNTSFSRKDVVTARAAWCCQPWRHRLGSDYCSGGGGSGWAARSWAKLAWLPSWSRSRPHSATMSGTRERRVPSASVHPAQYTAGEKSSALVRPRPPSLPGRNAKWRASTKWRHGRFSPSKARGVSQMAASCPVECSRHWEGGTVRGMCFARGAAQNRRSSQAACKSGRRGSSSRGQTGLQVAGDELRMADRHPQRDKPALRRRLVSHPHVRPELVCAWWCGPGSW